jgi:predicted O-methyltransferase YrrM
VSDRSRTLLLADLLHPSGRAGVGTVVGLAVAAVAVPVVLVVLFTTVDGSPGSTLLGLVLGVLVDLALAALLLVVVSHRLTSRRLRDQRRVLATLESRAAGADRRTARLEKELRARTEPPRPPTGREAPATRGMVEAAATAVGNRLQATQNLFAMVAPRGPVPPLVGYVASPDVLLELVQRFLTLRPTLTLECGSGTSTLFLALAAQQHGVAGRIVSLESSAEYAEATRALLAEHGVAHLAEVRHAPLGPTELADHDLPWYDRGALEDLHDIGLAFVDGPPGTVGPAARYPFVPLLLDRFAPRCAIVLDDANRSDERGVLERWADLLPDFDHRFLTLARGAGLFERVV